MPLSRKLAALIITGKVELSSVVKQLTKYKMLTLLPSIKQALVQMAKEKEKDETLTIYSPFPLSDTAVSKVRKVVGEEKARHHVVIDKNVLAGFRAKYKGMMYDGSAERIIKQLVNNH